MATSFHSFMPISSSHSSSLTSSSLCVSSSSSSSVTYVCPHLALGSCSCSTQQVTKKRKRPHQQTKNINNVSSPHVALGSRSCSTQATNKQKRGHQETKKINNVSSSLLDISSYPNTNVCLHLSLSSVCTACLGETQTVKKLKLVQQETVVSTTNNTCKAFAVVDPWMIKKVLKKSDLDDNCRLLLNKVLAKKWVVPVVDKARAENEGVEVEVFDVDTGFPLSLTFKIRPSNDSHVFNKTWMTDFVDRRNLKTGDEIGLKWNEDKKRFDFSVLDRS